MAKAKSKAAKPKGKKPAKPRADRGKRVGGKPVDAPEVVQSPTEATEAPGNHEAPAGDQVNESTGAIPEVGQSHAEPAAEIDPSVIDASYTVIDEPAAESKPLRLALDVERAKAEAEALWNADFVRQVQESERKVRELAGDHALAHAEAARKKKALDAAEDEHFELIRKLKEERNQPNLFPGYNPAREAGKTMEREGLTESPDKDLPPDEWEAKRGSATEPAAVGEAEDLSWREISIEELGTIGGLKPKIVSALLDYGIRTMGGFADYSTPKPGSTWTADLKDIPGIGAAAVQRIWEADTKFWVWWNGKEQQQARQAKRSGIGSGTNPGGGNGPGGEPSSVGDRDGARGDAPPGSEASPAGSNPLDSSSPGESRDEFAADFNDEPALEPSNDPDTGEPIGIESDEDEGGDDGEPEETPEE